MSGYRNDFDRAILKKQRFASRTLSNCARLSILIQVQTLASFIQFSFSLVGEKSLYVVETDADVVLLLLTVDTY